MIADPKVVSMAKRSKGKGSTTSRPHKRTDRSSQMEDPKIGEYKREIFHELAYILDGICEHRNPLVTQSNILQVAVDLTKSELGLIGEINIDGDIDLYALMVSSEQKVPRIIDRQTDKVSTIPVTGILRTTIKEGASQIMNDLPEDPKKAGILDLPMGHMALSNIICVPFNVLDQVMGIMVLANKEGGFGKHDDEVLNELANLVSLARSKMTSLERAMEQTDEGIAFIDRNGVMSSVNPAMEKMFDYSASEIKGRSFLGLFLDYESDSPMGEAIAGAVMEGSWTGEAVALRRDGRRFPVALSLTAIDEDTSPRTGFMVLMRDLSKEKEAITRATRYLETAQVILLALDIDGCVTMINRKGEEILGWKREELMDKDWVNTCIPKEDHERIRQKIDLKLDLENSPTVPSGSKGARRDPGPKDEDTYTVIDRQGKRLSVIWNHSVIRDDNGIVKGLLLSGRDITELTMVESKLRDSEELYKSLIRASPDAILVSDLEANIVDVSSRALAMYGTNDPQDFIGRNSLEFISPKDHARAKKNMQATLRDGIVKDLKYSFLRKDGSSYQGQMSASVIRDGNGNAKNFIAIVRDITEQSRAEQHVREAEQKYRSLFEDLPVGIVRTSLTKGRIVLANTVAARIMGYNNVEDFIKNTKVTDIYPESIRTKFLTQIQKYGFVNDYRINVITRDGSKVWVNVNARVDPTGEFIDASGFVITDVVHTEKRLQEAEEKYRSIFDLCPAGIMRTRLSDGAFILANDISARCMGYKDVKDLMENSKITDFYADPSMRKRLMAQLREHGEIKSLPVPARKRDGTPMMLLINARLDDDAGYIDLFVMDITRMKETEKEAQVMDQRYRKFFERSPIGLGRTAVDDGRIVMANRAMVEILGYDSVEEFMQKENITLLFPKEARRKIMRSLRREGRLDNYEAHVTKKDGQLAHVVANLSLDPSGQFVDIVVLDITRMGEIDARMKEDEGLKVLFRTSTVGHARLDIRKGRAQIANESFARMFGYDSSGDAVRDFRVDIHVRQMEAWKRMIGPLEDLTAQGGEAAEGMDENTHHRPSVKALDQAPIRMSIIPQTPILMARKDGKEMKVLVSGCRYEGKSHMDLTFIDKSKIDDP